MEEVDNIVQIRFLITRSLRFFNFSIPEAVNNFLFIFLFVIIQNAIILI